ncbi:MAG: PilZ domain-containing protein [Halieaceae bacterium]
MRKFIRHPTCVPIDIAVDESQAYADGEAVAESQPPAEPEANMVSMVNISAGGLAFTLLHPISIGSRMNISMPQVWPDYAASGSVAWCREVSEGFEVGVEFTDVEEAFKARMVAQFCQIEDYRRDMREKQGRMLSSEEAAREWIVQYAADFADTVGWQ